MTLRKIALSLLGEMKICPDCHEEFLKIIEDFLKANGIKKALDYEAKHCSNIEFDDRLDNLLTSQKDNCQLNGHKEALINFLVAFQNRVYYFHD